MQCKRCKRSAEPGFKTCSVCLESNRKQMRRRADRAKRLGICKVCRRPAHGSRCDLCLAKEREYAKKLKIAAFEAYGGLECRCCGEKTPQFLSIDHRYGNGNAHRRAIGIEKGGDRMYRWLKRNEYPDGFQVLCFNCNIGRQINGGICPHKETL